ncbi:MAG TPA: transposase, partial [Alphaproteobacteria bacterium]|nr:transposase [Alphaproteobacteria bacterium]
MVVASLPILTALLETFRPCFTSPTYRNFYLLALGAILAQGRRTVTELLRVTRGLGPQKHFSTYHRLLSQSRWSLLALARILAGLVVGLVPPGEELRAVGDDTTARRTGSKVYGVGCHRDAVSSTKKVLNFCFGHKWVVLAVLVRFPWTTRPWALPVLCLLYRTPKSDEKEGRKHRTLEDLMTVGLRILRRWFPARKITFVGDGAYGSHRLAGAARRLQITVVSRLRKDAALYAEAPRRRKGQRGRPRKKGRRLASPEAIARHRNASWTTMLVEWYGGRIRQVRWLSGTGCRHTPGQEPILIRWVLVEDLLTGRQECFYSTDPNQPPQSIIETYVLRWYIETTFQECRRHLGLETSRNRVRNSVLRTVPCLFGLFSVITVWFARHCQAGVPTPGADPWYHKDELTFTDVIALLRRQIWSRGIFLKS